MKKTNIILIAFAFILLAFLIVWFGTQRQGKEVETNYEEIVSQYIKDNISELSSEPEVLGGTFYVTNIDFLEDNLILVDFEDGHIDLRAEAKYSVINNEIIIDYFRLINNEETETESARDHGLVYNYISANISQLSPESEVLGGSFYVVNIDFVDENLAIVEYEDGHVSYSAQATYSIVDNQVVINSFKLIEEELEELSENDLVISYIEENISQLSPESEVLGGSFYVTNIDFLGDNLLFVEYEDGHIALEANVVYSVSNNQVSIESFEILENELTISDNELVIGYLENNISELSPEPEVLGGTFYVVNVDFIDENQAIVEYEDGHIAFEAMFFFQIDGNRVIAESFELIQE